MIRDPLKNLLKSKKIDVDKYNEMKRMDNVIGCVVECVVEYVIKCGILEVPHYYSNHHNKEENYVFVNFIEVVLLLFFIKLKNKK